MALTENLGNREIGVPRLLRMFLYFSINITNRNQSGLVTVIFIIQISLYESVIVM